MTPRAPVPRSCRSLCARALRRRGRGQRWRRPGRARLAERRADQRQLLVGLDLHRRDLPARPGLAALVHLPLPPPAPRPVRGRRPGPRQHEPGARVDGGAGAGPRRDRHLRLLEAAGNPGRALRGCRGRPGRRAGEGLPLLLELHLSERRDRGRPAAGARRPERAAGGLGSGLRRDPLLVDPRARRQVRCDSGHDERDVVQRDRHPGSTAASAPSSAGSNTRR